MIKKLIILLLISPPFCMGTFATFENSIKSDDKDEMIRNLIERVSNLETKYSELEDKVETLLEKVFFLYFDP